MLSAVVPVAHAGHYLWLLYLVPVVIVLASVLNSVLRDRRERREAQAREAGSDPAGSDPSDARHPRDHENRAEPQQREPDARP